MFTVALAFLIIQIKSIVKNVDTNIEIHQLGLNNLFMFSPPFKMFHVKHYAALTTSDNPSTSFFVNTTFRIQLSNNVKIAIPKAFVNPTPKNFPSISSPPFNVSRETLHD